jgi:Chromosome segregation ATPases
MSKSYVDQSAVVEVRNIGGIDRTTVAFDPGVAVLTGRNATNRTSLLQALMGVLGSEQATLKADADEGEITLNFGGETYSRRLLRENGRVRLEGDPYLNDATVADLFAFLLEGNRCRQAVARGEDLRELIMQPVDTEEIEAEIQSLKGEQSRVDDQIEELESLADRLPELEREYQQLQSRIDEKSTELSTQRETLADVDGTIEESREENEELDDKMSELQDARQEHTRIQREITTEKESIDALQSELGEYQETLNEQSSIPDSRLSSLTRDIQRIRGHIDAMNQTITELQSVIQFNNDFLEDDHPELLEQLQSEEQPTDHAVTDELVDNAQELPCWTCGETVPATQIESTLDTLRAIHRRKRTERTELKAERDELQDKKSTLETKQQRYETTKRKRTELQDEISDRQDRLHSLKSKRERVAATISQLEDAVTELQQADQSEVLELHETVNQLEFKLSELRTNQSNVETEIESIETRLDEQTELEARREEIQARLEDLRTRVEQLQTQAIESFNEHMEAVLDLLDYDNLERIWIEQTEKIVRKGRRKEPQQQFELHIVRSTESGTVYEDTIDHLSESEREVTGIIFALAGYLAHDVYRTVPFLLLDSVEAIDSDRIARLVEYLNEYVDYLVVALLTEDAAALDERYTRIRSI